MIKKLLFTFFLVLLQTVGFAQNTGDFRSAASGNWTTLSSWQYYNGSLWVAATSYPGQIAGTGTVTIRNGNDITISNSPPFSFTALVIGEGISGNLIVGADVIVETLSITINAGAKMKFSGNNNIRFPENSVLKLSPGGEIDDDGTCNNNVAIYIGSLKYAVCVGSGNAAFTFDQINSGQGTLDSKPSSNSPVCGNLVALTGTYSGTINVAKPVTYLWTATGPSVVNFSSNTASSPTATTSISGVYLFTLTVTNDGFSNSETITVTVNANPIAGLTSNDADNTFCAGTSVIFTATGGTNYNFRIAGTSVQNSASATYATTALTSGQVVDVIVANASGCTATSSGITNTVNALPNNVINGFSATTICTGESPQLNFDAEDSSFSTPYRITYKNDATPPMQYTIDIPSPLAYSFTPGDNPTSNTGYTLVSISNASCITTTGFADSGANLIVRPMPTATISGTTSVCVGDSSPPKITFTNPQTVAITITYTINGVVVSPTVDVAAKVGATNGTTTVSVPTTTAGSFVYALVSVVYSTNPSCGPQTLSGSATVTVNSLPSAPTVTITQPTCTVAAGSVSIISVSGETYSFDGNAYSSTLVYSGLTEGSSHTIYAKSAVGCISPVTSVVINTTAKTWNGAWSPSAPTSADKIVFNGDYSSSGDLEGCSCEVNSGAIIINSGHTLKITNAVTVSSGGSLTFEDKASLVQIEDAAVNTGNITYKRITPSLIETDYTYWSSPVADHTLNISPDYAYGTFYSFDSSANNWADASLGTKMDLGKGYIIRGQKFDNTPYEITATFKGIPNNGAVSISGIVADKLYLLGNPYPSALDAYEFLTVNSVENPVLGGTIYFWTHKTPIAMNTPNPGSGVYAYTSNDYATYNLTGGVGTDGLPYVAGGNASLSVSIKPSGKIAAGQAFFAISSAAGGAVAFKNSMRVGVGGITGDNSQFFKMSNSKGKSANTIKKNRVWLNLTNNQGAFKQMLVGYVTGATNGYDNAFDGESFGGNEFVDFYSVNDDKNLTIQGRALPFEETDIVPLGYSSNIEGSFAISIDEVDGALASQTIFIEDKDAKIIHNLKEGAYNFTTVKGTFNNRFVLRYTNKTLGTGDSVALKNSILVSNKNKQIKIDSPSETIDKVIVYDLSGRKVFQKNNINDIEFSVFNLVSKQQVLVVKITLQNGQTVTKKIMY